jgi:hypothetical protein
MKSNITQRNEAMSKFDTNVQCEEQYTEVQVAVSGCCNVFLDDIEVEHEVCPCCKDHCEVIIDYMPVQL